MCEEVLSGELWARLEPLIPVRPGASGIPVVDVPMIGRCWRASCTWCAPASAGSVRRPGRLHAPARSHRGPRGPEPGRPAQARLQAPPDHRRHRRSARRHLDRWQPQRRHPAHAAHRCGPADPGRGRHATSPAVAASNTARARAGSAGRWNAPSPGSNVSGDSEFAPNDESMYTRPSSAWPARSSAFANSF